jgi:serine/threonine protein kinase
MEPSHLPSNQEPSHGSASADSTLSGAAADAPAFVQIGPYRLLKIIGEGGMGEVWLAEQKTPIHRTVALKLIKAGMDTKAVVARFESERQALALMDHPNIAQVYDAGSTPEGRPYFVMEYVPGLPITEYCDKHCLSMSQRLAVFMQVCDGVQHAHQKAIIHRDLKPSNVLVVERDDKPIPKIIDFGLAKAIARRLTEKTMFTELGALVGTPEYMSPEQADLDERNVDTRTDVYSLGVILYELLVGALPFDSEALRAAGLDAILRVIREQEPLKPSTKVRQMGESSAASAEKRKEEPRSFARRLQGELDWITLKALEKDRARRYGSASELSADLARYLHDEPVLAGPATAAYRVRKYAARHRFGLAAAAAVLVLLAGFTVVQAVELRRVRQERDRADHERDRANRVTEFMTRMFKVSDPGEARGNSITAREILDKASAEIDAGLNKDPELQAQMMFAMATVYDNLGLYARAQSLDERTLDLCRRAFGPEDEHTLKTMQNLGRVLDNEGHYPQAEKLLRGVLETERRAHIPEEKLLQPRANLAFVLYQEGQFAEAEKQDRQVLETQRRTLGPANPDTLRSMSNLGAVLIEQGKYDEAEKLHREALAIQRTVLGPDHPDTIQNMSTLAIVLYQEHKYSEAEQVDREVLDIERRVYGPEHPYTLLAANSLASIFSAENRLAAAEKLHRETLEAERRVLGPEHRYTLMTLTNLSLVLTQEHHYAEAEKVSRETLAIQRRVLGPKHPDTAAATYNLACVVLQTGRRDEALSLLRQAVDNGLAPQTDLNMDQDSALTSLHSDARFQALLAHAKETAATAQKAN